MPLFLPLSLQLPAQDPLHTVVVGDCRGGGLSRKEFWSGAGKAVVVAVFQLRAGALPVSTPFLLLNAFDLEVPPPPTPGIRPCTQPPNKQSIISD